MEGSRRSEAGGKPLQKNGEEGEPEPQSSGRDSGNVSQSHSSASGVGEEDGKEPGAATLEPLLSQAAAEYCSYLLPGGFSPEIETLDKSLEDLLTRVDEFVGMLDMIRNDSSQVVNESVPQIHTKAAEMKTIYKKIDMLETFVKTVGNTVSILEEQVTQAETDLGAFPSPIRKFLHNISIPPFFSKFSSTRQQQPQYVPPDIFKAKDYFPGHDDQPHP
ncbi:biogenesis of lysosome-related organelles complex 1 subunit 4 isoform X1 [Rhinatrema bivittatum]|uniref:biogenesis of lysosome-related organelles complex 1 subunit 4 isoform X1 n=1 Tax=Rhinatrema bivittatum TaxID=194408 RepID=UPI00112B935D|nr:biogenesis of lysosome-related organelles complex 1 subunit 4 isoform X1 [Rhinatrema bivittatum]